MKEIVFNQPFIVGTEFEYVRQAIANMHLSGDGPFTARCNRLLASMLGAPAALLTTSCTHALEMAAILLEIASGDEVIVPSFTFVSTANAFVLRGARPVFVDIRPDTLNLDETALERHMTARTKAIVPVHYAGVACEMGAILDIAGRAGARVVEDNAHGLLGAHNGKALGTFGCLATQSFHETKNMSCGEGGALVINDPSLVERAEIVREKGTNRRRFMRGEVDKYTWVDIGSSFLPSELLAAFLFAQLEARDTIQALRRKVWERYRDGLADWAAAEGIGMPFVPTHCEQPYHMFYLLMPSLTDRTAFIAHLRKRDIRSVFHYQPLHVSEMGMRYGGRRGQCPVAESVSERLVRLPFYNGLEEPDQSRVIEAARAFKPAG